jgi:hypothetical protein
MLAMGCILDTLYIMLHIASFHSKEVNELGPPYRLEVFYTKDKE